MFDKQLFFVPRETDSVDSPLYVESPFVAVIYSPRLNHDYVVLDSEYTKHFLKGPSNSASGVLGNCSFRNIIINTFLSSQ
jgi:hypothetical protein